ATNRENGTSGRSFGVCMSGDSMGCEGWEAQPQGTETDWDSNQGLRRSHAIPLRAIKGVPEPRRFCADWGGITAIASRFLRWPQDHFAYEALRRLRDQHGDDVAHVFRLQHLFERLARVRRKVCMRRAGANHGDANVVSAKLFGYGIRETIQSPLGSSVGSAVR